VHIGGGLTIGQAGGSETVTLTATNLPAHTHVANAASAGTTLGPAGHYWAADPGENVAPYAAAPDSKVMSGAAIGAQGGSQPHENIAALPGSNFHHGAQRNLSITVLTPRNGGCS
jgi:microcystin-dependent protein